MVSSTVGEAWTLKLRVPGWCAGSPVVSLNGEDTTAECRNGYLAITRQWGADDRIDVFFPSQVLFERLEGAEELACAVDGPIVLAGLTDHDTGLRGDLSDPDSILLPEQSHTYGAFVWKQNAYLTRRQKESIRMIPLYEVTDQPYTVYFTCDQQ